LVLLLTIGTGIGSVLSYNGALVPNTEFGHIQFKGDSAEKYASDAAKKKFDLSRKEWGGRFNEYLVYLENLLYPDLIILGGGVSKKFEKYNHLITTRAKVVPAKLLNNAGIIGAAIHANERL
jgi:polyphosphate glucokinase